MPVCGAGDPNGAANMTDVSIWAFHGENDVNVPVSGSRNIIAAIQKAGGDPKYTEFPNTGHNIWEYVTKTPGVFDWLFQQRKHE
jgi:predicted peptidase